MTVPTPPPVGDSSETERIHDLKTRTPYFDAVLSDVKTFEIRKNDRDFKVGDTLRLREWAQPLAGGIGYTGRETTRVVCYMTDFAQQPGYVVLGFARRTDLAPTINRVALGGSRPWTDTEQVMLACAAMDDAGLSHGDLDVYQAINLLHVQRDELAAKLDGLLRTPQWLAHAERDAAEASAKEWERRAHLHNGDRWKETARANAAEERATKLAEVVQKLVAFVEATDDTIPSLALARAALARDVIDVKDDPLYALGKAMLANPFPLTAPPSPGEPTT